jgi:hypothetical protein
VAAFDRSSHYASPEQLQGGTVDFRSEIYSLGATMWFLLTAAPPLVAPKGPLAMQPTTTGLAVDKLKGMPKKVRRLLGQMLSVDPVARPQDPLAVYRQIQECVAQVERRESMAKRLGVPFLSGAKVAALPSRSRRPFPKKMVALAAVIIALATLGSIAVASYLRHQRIRQAEEPIGVPIGVTQPAEAPPPVTASAPTTASAPAPAQPEQTTAPVTITQTNQAPPVTASAPTVKPLPTAPEKTEPAAVVQNNPPPPPAESTAAAVAENKRSAAPPPVPQSTPAVVANNEPTKQPAPEPATTLAREESPKVAANDSNASEEEKTTAPTTRPAEVRKQKRKSEETEGVANARSVTPEVRRAEPATPAEGPDEEVAPTTEQKVATTKVRPKKEQTRTPQRDGEEEAIPRAEPVEGDEQVAQAPMPQLPRNRTRAKFIGVTADGNWMFSLPSKKIVIVPPPPGG